MSWWRAVRSFVRDAVPGGRVRRPAAAVVPVEATLPHPTAAAQVAAAWQALRRGDQAGGELAALEALEADPSDLMACFVLGQARLLQGRFESAREAFEQAVEAGDPFGLASAWRRRTEELIAEQAELRPTPSGRQAMELERAARAALRRGDPRSAEPLAREAVALDPSDLLAHYYLGLALLRTARRAEALRVFEAAREYDGDMGLVDGWLACADRLAEAPRDEEPWEDTA